MTDDTALALLSFGDGGWGWQLLIGAGATVYLALAALAAGLVFGLLVAGAKLVRFAPLRWLAEAYTLIVRGTPELLILLFIYYGSELAVNALLGWFGVEARMEMPKFLAAALGLSMIFGAYASEVFRGAYLAVSRGQMEAASAYGMTPGRAFWRIRLPQMWRFALPGLGNLWMVLLKDTSLAAVIAYDDLLRKAKIAGEATQRPLLFFLTAAALYLVLAALSDIARRRVESRVRRGHDGARA